MISCPADIIEDATSNQDLVYITSPPVRARNIEGQILTVIYNDTRISEATVADGRDRQFIEGEFPVGTSTIMATAAVSGFTPSRLSCTLR